MLPLKDGVKLEEPECTINMESKKCHSEIEMKTTEKDVKLDGLLIDFRNNLTQTHVSLPKLFKSMDSDCSANIREDEEKQELNSDSEDNENSELSDKASQLKATTCLANIMSSFSVFNQGLKKKVLNSSEKEQILLSSKTAAKILSFDSKYYEIEVEKKNKDVQITYKCRYSDCNKHFTKAQNFVVHMKMHLGIKKYICKFCDKSFSQKGNMRKHLKRHEVPSLQQRKTIKCKYCNSLFTEKYNCQVSQ